jgi:hypothetical protein
MASCLDSLRAAGTRCEVNKPRKFDGMLIILLAVATIVTWTSLASARGEPTRNTVTVECAAEVFFLPFDRDTPIAVDADRIKRDYNISSCLSGKAVARIAGILDEAKPSKSFLAGAVRLSVKLPGGRTYLVDQKGNVKVGKRVLALSEEAFRQLQGEMWASLPIFDMPE